MSTTETEAALTTIVREEQGAAGIRRAPREQRPFVLGGPMFGWSAAGAIGIVVVALTALLPLRGLYRATGGTMEEGFMLYFPELLRNGKVPNVDFLHLYGPGSLHALMGWYEVFGNTLAVSRTFGLLQNLGIIFALYAIGRAWGRGVATGVGVVAVLIIMTPIGIQAMAWHGGLALGLWMVVFALRARCMSGRAAVVNWAIAGLLGGVALAFRPDLIVAVLLVAMVAGWRDRAVAWKPLLGASIVGLIPMWIHLVMAGPRASIEGMVIDPVVNLRPGRELPSPPSWNQIDGSLLRVVEYYPPWWELPAIEATKQLYFWFWGMVIAAIAIPAWAWWRRRRGDQSHQMVVLLVAGLFALGILGQGVQRPDSTHLAWVTIASWPLLVPIVAMAIPALVRRLPDRWRLQPAGAGSPSSAMTSNGGPDDRDATPDEGIDLPEITLSRVASGAESGPRRRIGGGAAAAGFLAVALLMLVVCPFYTYRHYVLHTRVSVGNLPFPFSVERDGRTFYFGAFDAAETLQHAVDDLDRWSLPGERLIVGPYDLSRTYYNETVVYWMFPDLEPGTYYLEMDPGVADTEDSGLAEEVAEADWILLTRFWQDWWEPNTSAESRSQAPNQVMADQFCLVGRYDGVDRDALVTLYQRCGPEAAMGISPAEVDGTTPVVDVVGR